MKEIYIEKINSLINTGEEILDDLFKLHSVSDVPEVEANLITYKETIDSLVNQLPNIFKNSFYRTMTELESCDFANSYSEILDIEQFMFYAEELDIILESLNLLKSELNIIPSLKLNSQNIYLEYLPQKVIELFNSNYYEDSVFNAYKFIETEVRKKGKFPDTLLGIKLMSKAFNENNGTLNNKLLPKPEQAAQYNLFAGAIGFIKNPKSHHNLMVSQNKAFELLCFANYLLRILDSDYSEII